MTRMRLYWFWAPAAVWLVQARPAWACAVCFGRSDSNLAKGLNMGIFALLGVIVTVLAGVAGFFIYLARRAARMNREPSSELTEQPTPLTQHV